ncbi:hypothetical protein NDU88_002951 [Pleurodeles waltl]|uniref:Uncharacterized protein n=1 Tax=Pleurodeles waltl TaxID=8319 RepID=A0AAV7UB35_PLEWA|nr:hypothetical protein NDU88_002951 [Pleurodeles waltl]
MQPPDTRPLIHFTVPHWAAPSTSLQPEGAPALVPICPEPHLRALRAIAASHPAFEAAPQRSSTREQQTSSPSNQHAPSSRPHGFAAPFDHVPPQRLAQHSTWTSCSPPRGCFTSPYHSAQADSTPTGAPRAPSPRRASLLHYGCCLARLSAKPGSSHTSLIFRPSGAPKYSVSNSFGLQDYYRIVRRPAELRYGAAILRPGKLRPPNHSNVLKRNSGRK